jgi:predicted P-loop ATPase/GTPase
MFGVERCATALVEARVELASPTAGDLHVDVDAVVANLQATIRHVREVQAEMQQLGDGSDQGGSP